MKYKILLFLTFLFQNLFSQTGGESLYSFLNTPTSPKQIALGGVTLTSRNDVSQLLWNPSSLNEEIDGDVSINFVNYIADINVGSLVYAKSINPKYGMAFLGVQYFDYGDLDRTEASGPEILGSFSSRDLAFSLGYGYVYKMVSVGATLKYVSSKIDVYTSTALLYDFGITYLDPNSSFVASLVVRNSGKQLTQYIDTEEKVSNNVILAVEYSLEHMPIKFYGALDELNNWDISESNPSREKVDLNGEVTEENISELSNAFRHLSVGAELWPEKKINLRIGYNHRRAQEFQLEEVRTSAGLSYGFGINTRLIKFDYAFSKFQEGAKYSTFGLTLHL
ncbi:type IX secretion system protein PorQ [Wenyingzhuangia sp. 2_MG-2023]|uniref:type IX secretion system protein PorQ n=1 Tax=Wenyingzhuangia sp. 2_MG-2023 TaxID=3062639 RepID=UPI0026E3DD1C|nr:type IX secretion system protein PorQ [Wenyingzhuangia sp. 2_MG-2023]MDO6739144.1 type IX secretion system protein PorQ [Wenyingzhuangia sp. 2_MG-2023]MDO6803633.1 type IX secretion system protein PorQ [Wenyingzhuangia sp. 1_MG-2023]